MQSFRFGVNAKSMGLTADQWRAKVRHIEALGYGTLLVSDHIGPNFASIPALVAAAGATTTLRVGSAVFANDLRNPMMLAKEAATVDHLSGGRLEFGLGTGWMTGDYEMSGISFDPPADRVSRLDEAVALIRRLWTEEQVEHRGRWYSCRGATIQPRPTQRPHPPILVGGSGPVMLRIAARHADIVGITQQTGFKGPTFELFSSETLERKVAVIREAAGERLRSIELSAGVDVVVTDDPDPLLAETAARLETTAAQVARSPHFLYGPPDELRRLLHERRERYGINYWTVQEKAMDAFAPLARELAGH